MPKASAPAELLIPLAGLSVFDAQKGYASCVTFSLTSTPAAPVEEFYFWIRMCHWTMRLAGKELAHSESNDETIEAAAAMLNGRRLEQIELTKWVTPKGIFHGGMLWFEEDLTMQLQQYERTKGQPYDGIFSTRNKKQWVVYRRDGSVAVERIEGDEPMLPPASLP